MRQCNVMNQNYSKGNNQPEDSSGFFAYPSPHYQPQTPKRVEPVQLPKDDEDLSGCLASQGFAVKKAVATKQPVAKNYSDDDLSGCLASGFLRAKPAEPQTNHSSSFLPTERDDVTGEIDPNREIKPSRAAKPVRESNPSEDEGSGWLYLN